MEEAADAVRRSAIDEATAAMIDAVKVAWDEVRVADNAVAGWLTASINRPIEVFQSIGAVHQAVNRAYRDAVRAACDSP